MILAQIAAEQRAEACRRDRDATRAEIDAYTGPRENARVAQVRACLGSLSLLRGRFDEARERYAAARAALNDDSARDEMPGGQS